MMFIAYFTLIRPMQISGNVLLSELYNPRERHDDWTVFVDVIELK